MDNGLDVLRGRMSDRLITVADMLGSGYKCTADVGCDHGYISIYLVLKGISEGAIAMDLRKGPLSAAKSNIEEFGISDKVEVRLSDGLEKLGKGEADSLVIAGMGGKLMLSILEKRDIQGLGIKRAVLQPQSDIPEFRGYMRGRGFSILDEQIILEDGKYYFPMLVDFTGADESYDKAIKELSELCRCDAVRLADRYGVYNILRRDPLLKAYLEHGREVAGSIISSLDKDQHPERYAEVAGELSDIELLLDQF
ncbi:SAM-dependent methyltransferase [Butyrivibrio sp. CB08]|uniref:tRNA (adenine(22)-N(1))-methyltransferase n=1 Tax=Butyrivibrio sp. CB08 TaxID=2364879 RepID=UPI000EA9AF11|nr:class I SAM-dependent methyltransferase [Butyrivibrio sp. CB08]RKM61118.1 SAM-dependent methyltransferase [Butyrivibrio sp. CB08]